MLHIHSKCRKGVSKFGALYTLQFLHTICVGVVVILI